VSNRRTGSGVTQGGEVAPALVVVPAVESSFEHFYGACADRLVTQLFFVTGDREEARDCAQEAMAKAWQQWASLDTSGDGPVGWVYTVAYRIAVSRFRRAVLNTRSLWRMPIDEREDEISGSAEVIAVRDALSVLPLAQRAVLVLHYYEGLSVEAIAATVGLSPSGVKSRLARGRAALAQLLTDDENPMEVPR
jgi:RNA polymerase sigma-70 factor, ECF subfamily